MLISVIVMLVIVGFILYLLNTLIPMDGKIKIIINAVVLLAVFFYVLQLFGVMPTNIFTLK